MACGMSVCCDVIAALCHAVMQSGSAADLQWIELAFCMHVEFTHLTQLSDHKYILEVK